MFQTYIKLLQELNVFHIHLIHSTLMLVQSKVTVHKSNLKEALGFNLGWCRVLKMPFQLFVTLCNISELISKCFSNSIFSVHWGSQVSYCECTNWKQSQNSQLLIYWFIWGVVACVCFSASAASDSLSWSFGSLEIFEETSKVHFIFLLCVFCFFIVTENHVHGKCSSMSPSCVWFQTGQMWE